MQSLVWALAFILLVAVVPAHSSNTGTSKTYPLKAAQKLNRRDLLYFRHDFILVEDAIRQKLALSSTTANTSSDTEGTALINQDGHDIAYYIEVQIGPQNYTDSNETTYNLVIDTGSFFTWVYSTDCTSDDCSTHHLFDAQNSSSTQLTDNEFSITYTSGEVEGTIAIDDLSFAGFSSPQHFGLAATIDSSFSDFPIDGIMGLPAIDRTPTTFPGIINTLHNQSLISARVFGINLGRGSDENDEGSFTIGGIDDTKYTGDIVYTSTVADSEFWELTVDSTYIDGHLVEFENSTTTNARTAIIDTGTTLLIMAPSDAMAVHSYISGSQTDGSNYVIPCNTTLVLSFEFGGHLWSVNPSDYVGDTYTTTTGESESEEGLCVSNIQGIQFENNRMILGDVFLKNVYSVYNMDTLEVGFANKSIGSTEVTPDSSFVFGNEDGDGTSTKKAAAASQSVSTTVVATGSAPSTGALAAGAAIEGSSTIGSFSAVSSLATATTSTATATATSTGTSRAAADSSQTNDSISLATGSLHKLILFLGLHLFIMLIAF